MTVPSVTGDLSTGDLSSGDLSTGDLSTGDLPEPTPEPEPSPEPSPPRASPRMATAKSASGSMFVSAAHMHCEFAISMIACFTGSSSAIGPTAPPML